MALFVKTFKPFKGMRVLDLGGQPQIWDFVAVSLNITCLNLPGISERHHVTHHCIEYVEGDACATNYSKGDFDIVFSNSVIEHLGDFGKRNEFAMEVMRVSNRYWIQTPHRYFPLEAHCGMPFWWFYSDEIKLWFMTRWKKKLPDWAEMVDGTVAVDCRELMALFPGCKMKCEWFIFPKSIIAYSK